MKLWTKIIPLLLAIALLCACFASCVKEKPIDVEGEFFSEEHLERVHCEGMPVPKLENSVLRDGGAIYMNLSDEEYKAYIAEILNYLRAREDVFNISHAVDYEVLMLISLGMICVPIEDDCVFEAVNLHIVFSLEENIDPDTDRIADPVMIFLYRTGPKTLSDSDFEYNCSMSICNYSRSCRMDYCRINHKLVESELVVPYSDGARTVTRFSCAYCDYSYLGEECSDGSSYKVSMADGREYLKGTVPQTVKSGEVYKLYTNKYMDADIVLTVNGTRLYSTEAGGGELWCYTFVMPCEDIEISVKLTDGFLINYDSLASACPWLAELDSTDVTEISTVEKILGVNPETSEKVIKTSSDGEVIADFINNLRDLAVTEISRIEADIDGGRGLTIEFLLADGSTKALIINNSVYSAILNDPTFDGELYLRIDGELPVLP